MNQAALLLPILTTFIGCADVQKTAKEDFGRRYSCPADRVEVRPRKDIDAANLLSPPSKEPPPAEVKADPGRLAKWESDRQEQNEKVAAGFRRSYVILEVKGCDHDVLMACTSADRVQGVSAAFVCQEKPLPATNAR